MIAARSTQRYLRRKFIFLLLLCCDNLTDSDQVSSIVKGSAIKIAIDFHRIWVYWPPNKEVEGIRIRCLYVEQSVYSNRFQSC